MKNGALRVVQLTPPGSACSIVFGEGIARGAKRPDNVDEAHITSLLT